MQIDKILGKKIKYYRNLMHITQEQFSELINITPHSCYEIERHLKLPSLSLFLDICKVLKTPASCLLLETDKAFY